MWRCAPAVTVVCILSGVARAGLYIPGEAADFVPSDGKIVALSFDKFHLKFLDLTAVPAALDPRFKTSELGKRILAKVTDLERRKARLRAEEWTQLGGFEYRLAKWEDAMSAFQQAGRLDRRNFEVASNLAMVSFVQGQYADAWTKLDTAKSLQPNELPGFTHDETAWCYKVDALLQKIIRARMAEKRSGIPANQMPPDNPFGVEFVGESGSYEAGKLAQVQQLKLPEEAIAIVQQLLLWTPSDARLYWLLAELYNASGDLASASRILNECVDARRYQPDLLREHRRIIQEELARQQQEEAKLREQQLQQQKASEDQQARDKVYSRKIMIGVGVAGAAIILLMLYWQVGIVLRRVSKK